MLLNIKKDHCQNNFWSFPSAFKSIRFCKRLCTKLLDIFKCQEMHSPAIYWLEISKFSLQTQPWCACLNTLSADDEYTRRILRKWRHHAKELISQKILIFCSFFYCIFGIYIKFATFWKKTQPHRTKLTLCFGMSKMCDFFLKKGSISWKASALNVLTGTKIVKNKKITPKNQFLYFFHHFMTIHAD